MKIINNTQKLRLNFRFFIIPWFRILLWWGTEAVRSLFLYKKPEAQIHHISMFEWGYPFSCWFIDKKNVYCLISQRDEKEVVIHQFPKIVVN